MSPQDLLRVDDWRIERSFLPMPIAHSNSGAPVPYGHRREDWPNIAGVVATEHAVVVAAAAEVAALVAAGADIPEPGPKHCHTPKNVEDFAAVEG